MSALAEQLANYLAVRQHTLSTAHLTGMEQLVAEADYVLGEARELRDAVGSLADATEHGIVGRLHLEDVRQEIADVVLATTCSGRDAARQSDGRGLHRREDRSRPGGRG